MEKICPLNLRKEELIKEEITLPQLLRSDGYQTAHFGKWHLGHFTEHKVDGTEDWISTFGQASDQPGMRDYGYDYWFATGNMARPNHKNPQNFFLNGEAMGRMEGFSAQIIISWPKGFKEAGVKPGGVCGEPIIGSDVFPTL